MMGFPTIWQTQTLIRFMGVGSKTAGQSAAPDTVIKKTSASLQTESWVSKAWLTVPS
jgi:hypothetical protein